MDIDWTFTTKEVRMFRMRWNDGAGLDAIAAELGRSQLVVTLLVIEQAELGLIEQQQQGIYGNKKVSIKTPYFIIGSEDMRSLQSELVRNGILRARASEKEGKGKSRFR